MEELPAEWVASLERRLDEAKMPQPYRTGCHKWVKLYFHFCQKFGYPATAPTALSLPRLYNPTTMVAAVSLETSHSGQQPSRITITASTMTTTV